MDNNKKDFLENILRLNNQNKNIIQDSNENTFFIATVTIDSKMESTIIFRAITKAAVYVKIFTYNSFSEYKSSIGFDGSWKAFINTMYNAINFKEGGEIKIELKKKNQVLTMIHPLANDLKVSSQIVFESSYTTNEKEYNVIVFDSLINLYNDKIEIIRLNEKEKEQAIQLKDSEHKSLITNSSNFNSAISQKDASRGILEIKKNVKRKYQSNLINPNIKKRKKKGVQFIKDEEEKSDKESNKAN